MRRIIFPTVLFALLVPLGHASPAPVDPGNQRRAIADRALALLQAHYVFPAVAQKMARFVRNRSAAGAYDRGSDDAFARLLTEDLRAISHDKHLALNYSAKPLPEEHPARKPDPAQLREMERFAKSVNYGFAGIDVLPGNFGYLRIDGFMPAEVGGQTLAGAMKRLAGTKALIIDLRYSDAGGEPSMVALICSYLTGPKPIHLSDLRFRNGAVSRNWTSAEVSAARYLGRPVAVLTSARTFSAGEELAYDLQALNRATIIGERTGGGANPGSIHRIDAHFSIFVPDGQAISAITGKNWEGAGVVPDIAASPGDALERARTHLARRLAK